MSNTLRFTIEHLSRLMALPFFAVLTATYSGAAPAQTEFRAASDSTTTFEAVGKPSLLKIKGHGAKVTGQLVFGDGGVRGAFDVGLNEFETGIELRNRHMREKYLETSKFPKATLEIDHVELPKDWKPGTDVGSAKFQGKLMLKGTTKPVEGTVKISGTNMATEADFVIDISQFPIGVPSYMGVTVASSVNVHVTIPSFARK
jgi:polyisoprenoid-binding protein YceI